MAQRRLKPPSRHVLASADQCDPAESSLSRILVQMPPSAFWPTRPPSRSLAPQTSLSVARAAKCTS
eukprot:scaffold469228_cov13-Prasinocladus_malaysianus.AAC.1